MDPAKKLELVCIMAASIYATTTYPAHSIPERRLYAIREAETLINIIIARDETNAAGEVR